MTVIRGLMVVQVLHLGHEGQEIKERLRFGEEGVNFQRRDAAPQNRTNVILSARSWITRPDLQSSLQPAEAQPSATSSQIIIFS